MYKVNTTAHVYSIPREDVRKLSKRLLNNKHGRFDVNDIFD